MYNQTRIPNPKNIIKTTRIIHLALLIGQILFATVVFLSVQNPVVDLHAGNDVIFYIAPFMIISMMFVGSLLYKNQIKKAAEKTTINEKLGIYQTAIIMRCAASEGASLFCIVCTLISGNLFYLVLAGINIVYFIWIRPSKFKILEDLDLDYNENVALDS
jgi:hypothetical protein